MVDWKNPTVRTHNEGTGWWTLRVFFGVLPIVAGLDKFFNVLADWSVYLWTFIPDALGIAPETFMLIVGAIEIIAGIGVLTPAVRIFGFIVSAWLVAIALNLVITGYYDIAVRDVGLAVGAFVLGLMSPMPQEHAKRRRAGATA